MDATKKTFRNLIAPLSRKGAIGPPPSGKNSPPEEDQNDEASDRVGVIRPALKSVLQPDGTCRELRRGTRVVVHQGDKAHRTDCSLKGLQIDDFPIGDGVLCSATSTVRGLDAFLLNLKPEGLPPLRVYYEIPAASVHPR